ncbi:putative glycolipid-binding domain-containing protein [uncultured Brevibacillus sp.]|uniref:putative glycolipid-binding domain-containing protein n=1 Tax=uncultured Brevibacillus sp. TaxID=169970 RepID=UPI002594D7D0|nr:putative glycolipid-binding domain-containing protein [uncultured Brevibacillus sp.]
MNQSYTLLESGNDSALFRYQSGNFQESITVDSNDIVTVYPDLFYQEKYGDAHLASFSFSEPKVGHHQRFPC